MPTIVGILSYEREKSILGLSELEKMLNCLIFLYLWTFEISMSAELNMKKFYNLGAWPGTYKMKQTSIYRIMTD